MTRLETGGLFFDEKYSKIIHKGDALLRCLGRFVLTRNRSEILTLEDSF